MAYIRNSSIKLTLVAAAKKRKNNSNNNNPVGNIQFWKDHANPPNLWDNSLNFGRGSNIAGGSNINIFGRRDSSVIITSRSSDIAADNYIIIRGPLSERESRRRRKDLVRDPVVTLNSNGGNRELPTTDVTGVSADTTEAILILMMAVSPNQLTKS